MAVWVGLALLTAISRVAGADIESYYGRRATPRYCGYSVETHRVTASDDYITTVFRLPRSNSSKFHGQPVLLQHGFISNSDTWYQIGGNSLPCMLARAGYDVWLSNTRGNTYSTLHASLNPSTGLWNYWKYWDFSFHEMAVKDLPATIDYIRKATKKDKLSYIGHSMGGTLDFTLLSEVPAYNKKINAAVSLAPAVYIHKFTTEFINIIPGGGLLKWIACTFVYLYHLPDKLDFSGSRQNNEFDEFMVQTLKTLEYLLHVDGEKRKVSRYDRTSMKTLQHIAQMVCSGSFQKFTYGIYPAFTLGLWRPPTYNLRNVKTRHFIMYSDDDALVTGSDVRLLCKELPGNIRECHRVSRPGFGHSDFLESQHAKLHVNDHIMRFLGRYLPPIPTTTTTTTTPVNPECLVSK